MKTNILTLFFTAATIVVGSFFFGFQGMSDNWVAPYLSAAANLEWGGRFMISEPECIAFKALPLAEQLEYRFTVSNETIHYNHNPIGYVYIIRCATLLLPFVGDETAVMVFQLLFHLLFCLFILYLLRTNFLAFMFFAIGYMINPFILKYVAFNFYYFWQSIPSLLILILLIDKRYVNYVAALFTVVLPFILLARMTLVLSVLFLVGLLIYKKINWMYLIASLFIFSYIFTSIQQPTEKNIFHTIYVGIGAYKNPYVEALSDNVGYDLYKQKTGDDLDAQIGGNYYEGNVIHRYQDIAKKEVLDIVSECPTMFIKHAVLNTLQLYSFGFYSKGSEIFKYLSAAIGFIVLLSLLFLRQYWIIILIGIPSVTFTWFYPPIPAYMFGSYIFLLLAYYTLFEYLRSKYFGNIGLENIEENA